MESLTKQFPDKETFDKFFVENFKTMTYEDVKEGLEELVMAYQCPHHLTADSGIGSSA